MKMKKSVVGAMALALLAMSACTSESIQSPDIPSTSEEVAGRISFSISLPAGDPISYRAIQTDAEKAVSRLDVYQFSSGANGVLERQHSKVTLTPNGDKYMLTLKVQGSGKKDFIFVANNHADGVGSTDNLANLPIGTKRADFEKTLTKVLGTTPLKSPLVMTATSVGNEFKDSKLISSNPKVELERIMARMDIQNYEPQLKITHVTMVNVADRTFLMPQIDDTTVKTDMPSTAKLIQTPRIPMPLELTQGDRQVEVAEVTSSTGVKGWEYRHVAYPYIATGAKLTPEGQVSSQGAQPMIILEGVLFGNDPGNATKVTYHIPLKKENTNDFISFARNHRYTLVIERAFPDDVESKIIVDEWKTVTIDAPYIEPMIPRVTGIALGGYFADEANLTTDKDGNMVYTTSHASPEYKGGVATGNVDIGNPYVSTNTEWGVAEASGAKPAENGAIAGWLWPDSNYREYYIDNISGNHLIRTLKLTATKNTTGKDRSVRLKIYSKVDPSKFSIVTIVQKPTK